MVFFRYFIIKGASEYLITNEVELYDASNNNIALGKTATGPSVWGGYVPSNAVDGNTGPDNFFHSNNNGSPWLQIDLGQAYDIRRTRIYNEYNGFSGGNNGSMQYRLSNAVLIGCNDVNAKDNPSLRLWTATIETINSGSNITSPRYYEYGVSNKPTPTLTNLTGNITKQYGDSPFQLTPGSNSNGEFTFSSSNTSVATISGTTVTILEAGITTITISQAETADYYSASSSFVLTVNKNLRFGLKSFNSGNALRSIAYGNGLFVAVSQSGTGNRIFTSPDTVNWTGRTTPVTNNWKGIAYGNGLFVAVSNDGTSPNQVITSPDGINWSSRTAPLGYWASVTYGNGLFVAVGFDSGGTYPRIMTSPDGINWTSRTAPASNWHSITYGNGLYVAVSTFGTNLAMTSPDGITWTARSASGSLHGVTYGNGLFVAVGNSGVLITSPNGITWTTRTVPNNFWWGVTYGGGLFIAIPATNGASPIKSLDGINWSTVTIPTGYSLQAVGYGNGSYLTVSNSGAIFSSVVLGPATLSNFSETIIKNNGVPPFLLTDPSSNSTGAFTYTSSNTAVATISGKTVTIVGGGSTTITATQAAAGNYESGTISRVLTVRKGNPVLNNINIDAVGNVYKLIVNTNSSGSFTYSVSDSTAVTVNSDNTLSFSRPSDVLVIAKQAETSNYYSGEFSTVVSYTGA